MKSDPKSKYQELQFKLVVNRATWVLVMSFADSGRLDRHYMISTDRQGNSVLRFGDGKKGRVPNTGAKITATYRVGGGSSDTIPRK